MFRKITSIVIVASFVLTNTLYGMPVEYKKDALRTLTVENEDDNTTQKSLERSLKDIDDDTKRLIDKVMKCSRAEGLIKAGPDLPDIHGRIFTPDGRFFNDDGTPGDGLQRLIDSLSNADVRKIVEAGIMYYDIRSDFWRKNPEFTVILARAYAKVLQEEEGREDGITVNIGIDAYKKHFKAARVFADALLRTGICDNGGGINYWGVINGGNIRNYSQLYGAVNNERAHWIMFTMSHRKEDYLGGKMGVSDVVFCGPDVRHVDEVTSGTLYDYIVDKNFAEIKHKTADAAGKIISIDCSENNKQVAADMIKATISPGVEQQKFLDGLKIYCNMAGNPIGKDLVDMLNALGATLVLDNATVDEDFSTDNIIDGNEREGKPAINVLKVGKRTKETGCDIGIALDPDGDRITLFGEDKDGNMYHLTGTELHLLVMEAIAKIYKKNSWGTPTTISDMRTGLSAEDLAKKLKDMEYPIEDIPHEAGYPFFMEAMADHNAAAADENSLHCFTRPMTDPRWGGKKFDKQYQGGDNAAFMGVWLIACMKYMWAGRNPVRQLEWMRSKEGYGLPKTIIMEKKPTLELEDDIYKYKIAARMKELAAKWFPPTQTRYIINYNDPNITVVSGVHIMNTETRARMLVRYSNTGPGFTISGEAYDKEQLDDVLGIGYGLITTAVEELKAEGKEFGFDINDAASLKDAYEKGVARLGIIARECAEGYEYNLWPIVSKHHAGTASDISLGIQMIEALDNLYRETLKEQYSSDRERRLGNLSRSLNLIRNGTDYEGARRNILAVICDHLKKIESQKADKMPIKKAQNVYMPLQDIVKQIINKDWFKKLEIIKNKKQIRRGDVLIDSEGRKIKGFPAVVVKEKKNLDSKLLKKHQLRCIGNINEIPGQDQDKTINETLGAAGGIESTDSDFAEALTKLGSCDLDDIKTLAQIKLTFETTQAAYSSYLKGKLTELNEDANKKKAVQSKQKYAMDLIEGICAILDAKSYMESLEKLINDLPAGKEAISNNLEQVYRQINEICDHIIPSLALEGGKFTSDESIKLSKKLPKDDAINKGKIVDNVNERLTREIEFFHSYLKDIVNMLRGIDHGAYLQDREEEAFKQEMQPFALLIDTTAPYAKLANMAEQAGQFTQAYEKYSCRIIKFNPDKDNIKDIIEALKKEGIGTDMIMGVPTGATQAVFKDAKIKSIALENFKDGMYVDLMMLASFSKAMLYIAKYNDDGANIKFMQNIKNSAQGMYKLFTGGKNLSQGILDDYLNNSLLTLPLPEPTVKYTNEQIMRLYHLATEIAVKA
ncbi:MAG: hypothetical protein V2A72_01040 [Candidatus Omnitrophota bacterium]